MPRYDLDALGLPNEVSRYLCETCEKSATGEAVSRLKTKSLQPIYLRPIFYDGQADGLTLEVSWSVFRCFSSARVASIRLSLALS